MLAPTLLPSLLALFVLLLSFFLVGVRDNCEYGPARDEWGHPPAPRARRYPLFCFGWADASDVRYGFPTNKNNPIHSALPARRPRGHPASHDFHSTRAPPDTIMKAHIAISSLLFATAYGFAPSASRAPVSLILSPRTIVYVRVGMKGFR